MKSVALILAAVLLFQANVFPLGVDSTSIQSKEARRAAKAKAAIQKRGVDAQARVRVRLHDGSEIKGFISTIRDDSFDLTEEATGKVVTTSYADVKSVKGPGLSKPVEVLIGVGLIVAVIGLIFWAIYPKT